MTNPYDQPVGFVLMSILLGLKNKICYDVYRLDGGIMEKPNFTLEVPTVIKISGGEYNEEKDSTSIEIEATGIHIVFDLPGKHESKFAQKRIQEGIRRLNKKNLLYLAHTHLYPVLYQLP